MFLVAPHVLFVIVLVGVGLANESFGLVGGLLGLYAAGLYRAYRRNRGIGTRTETILTLVGAALSWLYSQHRGEHFLFAFQYILAAILVVRAFRIMEKRDYAFCLLVAAVLFGHIGRIYEALPFLTLTIAFLVTAPYALFSFLARFGDFQKGGQPLPETPLRPTLAQHLALGGIALGLIAVSVLVFVVLPRPRYASIAGITDERQRAAGFSEAVALGTFNDIAQRQNIVMAVETDKPTYWRGSVLDYYAKGVWRETARRPAQGMVRPVPDLETRPGDVRRTYELFDARLTFYNLPSAGNVRSVRPVNAGWRLWINDMYGTLSLHYRLTRQLHGSYEIVSGDEEFVGPSRLESRTWLVPDLTVENRWIAEEDLFLQVPADLPPRVRDLALRLTQNARTVEEKTDAIRTYLSGRLAYTTEDLSSEGQDPLDHFLFTSRRGHCEYFATAMAILLRCAGVHARVVQGFAPGTWVDGKYVVRMSDAHLWTEVFHPGRGWKTCDATPAGIVRVRGRDVTGWLESLRLRWQTYVLQYDSATQSDLVESLLRTLNAAGRAAGRWIAPRRRWLAGLLVLAVAAAGLFWTFRIAWRRFGSGARGSRSRAAAVNRARSYFGQYLKTLARHGYDRHPGTTPNDLLARLVRDGAPVAGDARLLTECFYAARFGGIPLTPDRERDLRAALSRIRRWSR